ncbi:MAG: outer membrane lipoprotein carrier protein LolA [Candidatus Adiutricales bacterium]
MISKKSFPRFRTATASLAFIFTLPTPAAWAEITKADVLAGLKDRYTHMTGLAADYIRVTTSPAMEKTYKGSPSHTASGRLFYKKPNKLRLNQTAPDPELLITDGTIVWWYIPEENVVQKYSGQALMTQLEPLLDFLNGLGDLEKSFSVSLVPIIVKGESRFELTLVPKTEGTNLQELIVWLKADDYTLTGFRFTSSLREITEFELSAVKLNPGISDSTFQFQVPDEAEVIDLD